MRNTNKIILTRPKLVENLSCIKKNRCKNKKKTNEEFAILKERSSINKQNVNFSNVLILYD